MASSWGLSWDLAWGNAWGIADAPPPPPVSAPEVVPSGGIPASEFRDVIEGRKTWRQRLEEASIQARAIEVIEKVAARQVQSLETDEQKRFEELSRELELARVQWDSRYLEALSGLREALIDEEISVLLKKKLEEEAALLIILAACI